MTVETQSGYTWDEGKHARILHAGNRQPIKAISGTDQTGGTIDLLDNDLTRDRWVPQVNEVLDPEDFSTGNWVRTEVTVGSDGQTLTETTATNLHRILQTFSATSGEVVTFAAIVERQTAPEVRLTVFDSAVTFAAGFDLRDGTVGTVTGTGAEGLIRDLGGGRFLLVLRATLTATGSGNYQVRLMNGSGVDNYAGSTSNTLKVERVIYHDSISIVTLETFGAKECDCLAIGAHNLWSTASRVVLQEDANDDGTYVNIAAFDPPDDSPIMLFINPLTSGKWRVLVRGGALPEVGVIRLGSALKFERPFYAGFTPARMNRATDVIGNMSRTGELIGRSIKRTVLAEGYQWQNLTYDWVRANLDGRSGVIQSLEAKTAFLAWRPSETDDVSYIMRASPGQPRSQGMRDLWSFDMSAEVYSYE